MGRLLLLCMILLAGCQQSKSVRIETDIPSLVKNALDTNFVFHGDTLYHHEKKYSGFLIKTYVNGDTASYGGYLNGLKEGEHKAWYPGKQLMETRWYIQDMKTGAHKGFWEDGKPRFEYVFENGEHQGSAKEWYQNGKPYREFHYDKGYEEGSQRMWWENGVIRANYVVKHGRRFGLIGLKLCANPVKSKKP